MKTISLFLFYAIVPIVLAAQPASIGIGFGRASYAMDDLKLWNEDLGNSIDFEHGITSSFPDWWMFSVQSRIPISPRLSTCVNYNYNSSGSRISSKDYSGEYRIEQVINGYSLGTGLYYGLIPSGKTEILAGLEAGGTYGRHKLKEEIIIENGSEKEETRFSAWSIYTMPALDIAYPIGPIILGVKLGYNFSFMGRLRYQNYPVKTSDRKHVIKADWSGYRVLFSLSLPLNTKGDQPKYAE